MSAATPPPHDAEALQKRCEAAEATVEALRAELEETNRGVLALYAELDDRAQQLEEASSLKSRFLSYMSHEFRVPLGAIRSLSRVLLDELDGPLLPEQRTQVEFVQNSAKELSEMVDDLLDLAKVEAGRITISPAWFEMGELLAALRGMFRPLVESDAVSLVLDEPHGLERLYSDTGKLAQILRNFISNALKFTTQGEVRVSAEAVGDDALFRVTDTGIGMPEEQLASLFNDFSQLHSPLHKRFRGSGLGLSLSRKLASLLGGTVGVESTLGQGSTFWVRIPIIYQAPDGADQGNGT